MAAKAVMMEKVVIMEAATVAKAGMEAAMAQRWVWRRLRWQRQVYGGGYGEKGGYGGGVYGGGGYGADAGEVEAQAQSPI